MYFWQIVLYIYLIPGTMYEQRIAEPTFPTERLCELFIQLPQFQDDLITRYWAESGVAYVLPKCKHVKGT